jgi:hypothetical protein
MSSIHPDSSDLIQALEALLADHKKMFEEAHPHSTIRWEECFEVQQAERAIQKTQRLHPSPQ